MRKYSYKIAMTGKRKGCIFNADDCMGMLDCMSTCSSIEDLFICFYPSANTGLTVFVIY
jgi:hypothetical protein